MNSIDINEEFEHKLLHSHNLDVGVRTRYKIYYHILCEFLRAKTADSDIIFTGVQPRLIHVAQNCNFDDIVSLNSFRFRGRNCADISDKELQDNEAHDFNILLALTRKDAGKDTGNIETMQPIHYVPSKNTRKRRVSVVSPCDDGLIVADETTSKELRLTVPLNSSLYPICSSLPKGTQLNLLDVTEELVGDQYVLHAQHIVLMPDILIDVTSVAKCFEEYGTSELTFLIGKIKPQASSQAILLGNFASQLLDEAINNNGDSLPYKESITKFFANNPIQIASCTDLNSKFHDDARLQQENLSDIIQSISTEDARYDKRKVMLEPSFICEAIGMQGRMDMLQSDLSLLVEQKSGKRDDFHNTHRTPHYVQILLYLAMLHYGLGKKNTDVSAYLLYSKYPDGLIKEANAPLVLEQAINLRNNIVIQELNLCSSEGVRRIFSSLTADDLNVTNTTSKLWERYQRPQISDLLNAIKSADEATQTYFYRFLSFTERENMFSRVGNNLKDNSGFASLWTTSAEERKRAGNMIDSLQITECNKDEYDNVCELTLEKPIDMTKEDEDEYEPNFRDGDVVIIYEYRKKEEPDVRRTIEHRATLVSISDRTISVRLRAPQRNTDIFLCHADHAWAMEHDYMDSSYTSQYRALYSVTTASEMRRRLILGQRKPEVAANEVPLTADYGNMNRLVSRAKRAKELFLVVGPPGTGKTSYGLMNILREELASSDGSVLLTAYTNRAVDEICSKLLSAGIDFLLLRHDNSSVATQKEASPLTNHLLSSRMSECRNATDVRNLILNNRIFVCTTSSMYSHQQLFCIKQFSLAIIDEASQILEPALVGFFTAVHGKNTDITESGLYSPAIKKFVLIGDQKQLPAVAGQADKDAAITDKALTSLGFRSCKESMFQRFIRLYGDDDDIVYQLSTHGRMHADIADFVNHEFYHDTLRVIPLPHQRTRLSDFYKSSGSPLTSNRWIFFNVNSVPDSLTEKSNTAEAEVIAHLIVSISDLYHSSGRTFTDTSVGVIIPYRNQIATIRRCLRALSFDDALISIDTVERYQGSERDVIIYGTTVSNLSQLSFLNASTYLEGNTLIDRKLNVAVTRARQQNIIVGNASLLSRLPVYHNLITYIKEHGEFLKG